MTDTLTAQEIAAIRQHEKEGNYVTCDDDRTALIAHLDALTAAVEGLPYWDKRSVPGGKHVNRAAVLAILKGEPRDD